jgi:hypothetical protein
MHNSFVEIRGTMDMAVGMSSIKLSDTGSKCKCICMKQTARHLQGILLSVL